MGDKNRYGAVSATRLGENAERLYEKIMNGKIPDSADKASIAAEAKMGIEYCLTNCTLKEKYSGIHSFDDLVRCAPEIIMPEISEKASALDRLRYLEPLHKADSENNIMAICFFYGTWVRPHVHLEKETYYHILAGQLGFLLFTDSKYPKKPLPVIMNPGEFFIMKRGIKHTCIILSDHSWVLSGKKGKYIPEKEKITENDGYPPDDVINAVNKRFMDNKIIEAIQDEWLRIVREKE